MVTSEQVAKFERDGFVKGEQVISPQEADALCQEVERVIQDRDRTDVPQPRSLVNLCKDPGDVVWQILNIWEVSSLFRQLLTLPRIVDTAAKLLEAGELRLWHDQIQHKPQGKGGVNMWHQDSPYWGPVEPKDQQVTAWIALDDAFEDNGCMSMVPGSHKWGVHQEYLHSLKDFNSMPDQFQGYPVQVRICPVEKGCVHFHHSLVWHGSHGNRSGRPRRAIALHFMSDKTVLASTGTQHKVSPYIQVAPGQKLEGKHFPLVWKDGQMKN